MSHTKSLSGIVLAVLVLATPAAGQAPPPREGKPCGVLRLVLREDLPQGFALHESATNSVTWPAMPCYSNLVIFDQLKQLERPETIVPELAERWSWQDGYRNLVFFLRRDVRWQSQEIDPQKRLALAHWPHVRNLVPHNVTYNWARHQETWLDR